MTGSLFMYGIAILAIILGFIALLTQKVYIDSATNQPTEVEIPLFGKIKTNIPALVFVFLGFATAIFAFNKSSMHKTPWRIDGVLTATNEKIDWEKGTLTVLPSEFESKLSKNGHFTITMSIEDGKTFEEAVGLIDYSHEKGSIRIKPPKEYEAFMDKKASLLKEVGPSVREYKNVPIEVYP